MSNHRARTWDHRGSKPLDPKLLPLGHHLDGSSFVTLTCIMRCQILRFGISSFNFFSLSGPCCFKLFQFDYKSCFYHLLERREERRVLKGERERKFYNDQTLIINNLYFDLDGFFLKKKFNKMVLNFRPCLFLCFKSVLKKIIFFLFFSLL
jgi:hypothetical protein